MSIGFAGRRRTAAVRARMPNPPLGFLLLSTVVIVLGWMAFGALTTAATVSDDRLEVIAARAAGALVAATALLATEALWLVRRWVFAACVAFTVSLAVGWLLMSVPLSPASLAETIRELGLTAALFTLPLGYVHRRARRIHGFRGRGAGTP